MIRVSAFKWVPPFVQGLVRDLRVRWALEEAGERYEERLLGGADPSASDYRAMQPFGQVPTYEEDDLVMFESGAIVLRIAERSPTLLPREPKARARAISWLFAAINSIEPYTDVVVDIDLFHANEAWAKERRPGALRQAEERLATIERVLTGREYLEGAFSAGDLMMTTVLRTLRHTNVVAQFSALAAYQQRCEARPAFQRALAAHMAVFAKHAPPPKS